jgi:hypothetical protein
MHVCGCRSAAICRKGFAWTTRRGRSSFASRVPTYTVDPTPGGQWKAPDLARARRVVAASGTKGMKVTLKQIRYALSVQATEPTGAVALWARIERHIVDLAPWVPLFTPKRAQFVSARVGNYQYNPATGACVLLDQLWVR